LLQNGSNFQSVSVTMTIGGASTGGTVASPPSLTFNIPQGGSQQQTFIVNGDGTSFNTQSFGVGLSVTPPSGTTPAIVTVTANAASLNVGSAQVGTVTVTSSLGTQSIGVTVNVIAGQVLTTNPASLSYIYQTGNGPVTNVSVNSSADSTGGNLTFSVSSAPAFVSYTATSTTTPTVIGVGINPSKLGPGFNTGAMVLTAGTGAANSTLSVPITVLAPGTTPGLVATPNPVSLTGQAFGGPVTTSLAISGLAGTSFTAATNSSGNWLSVSPTSGLTSPASLTVTASPANLSVNNYQGFVTLTASNGSTLTITVNFAVGTTAPSTPALSVTPTTLTFNYRQGDSAPASQPVQISASGTASNFTVANSVNWISVSQTSGTTPSTLNVSIDTTKVPAGTNSGTLTISATGTTGSPQVVTVTANVTSPPVLSLNASTTSFAYRTGDPNPPNQAVQVSSTGAALNYTVTVSNASWLTVTPTSGSTPATLTLSVSPGTLDVGNYSATVTISATGSTQTLTVTLAVSAPLPTVNEVDNSASNLTGPVAPGEIIVIRGSAMGPETLVTYTLNGDVFATAIGGTRVLVGGFAAPMVYTSSGQVAAIVPYEIAGRTSTFVQVEYLSQRSNAFTVQVAATAPGVYTLNSTGQGPGAILNADYSVNSDANPVPVGGVIQVFATGEGQTIPPGVNGKLADDPILPKPVLPVTATISNIPATVTYMGAAPGLVAGLMQVNIQVPDGAKSGDVVLSIGGVKSQPGVTVSIR
jgi:uncharacterized protein (TIGR03437 family)